MDLKLFERLTNVKFVASFQVHSSIYDLNKFLYPSIRHTQQNNVYFFCI